MPQRNTTTLGMLPKAHGVGGMVSFQAKLTDELARRGIHITYDLESMRCDAVLVVGGTRQLDRLRRIRRQGVPVYQRLDGINWIHRVSRTGPRHYLRAELANRLLRHIRNRLVDGVIYQSRFVVEWWERMYGPASVPHSVVHNGVDLNLFSPGGEGSSIDGVRVLMVEGSLAGGYELGLEHGIKFCEKLSRRIEDPVELMIVGRADEQMQLEANRRSKVPLRWMGQLPPEEIPALDRSADLFFAADIHPACPNAVIEALACGLPVVGFDTGALKELVVEGTGVIVPYGTDPWRLEAPDFESLAKAAAGVLSDLADYRDRARRHAERELGVARMAEGYLAAMGLTGAAS